jgi:hypothetical protein
LLNDSVSQDSTFVTHPTADSIQPGKQHPSHIAFPMMLFQTKYTQGITGGNLLVVEDNKWLFLRDLNHTLLKRCLRGIWLTPNAGFSQGTSNPPHRLSETNDEWHWAPTAQIVTGCDGNAFLRQA